MNHSLSAMEARLSGEDRLLLEAIYEPQIVTVPPNDACGNLCVTPDGELRLYGAMNKKSPDDAGTAVYLSSDDCGLSWKTHLTKPGTLGAAARNPKTGRYIASSVQNGTYARLSDVGFDDERFRTVRLTEEGLNVHIMKLPYYFEEIGRWIIVGEYRREDKSKVL